MTNQEVIFLLKMPFKNIVTILLIIVLSTTLIPVPLLGIDLPLQAESAILMDAHSGDILYEKNCHKKLYPASMTKLMTLVLAMEAVKTGKVKMEDVVTASENASSYGGSQIFLSPGEKLTLKDLLLGVALASGNDASVAVAEYLAGTHEAFVDRMNQKAKQLGMKDTHFVNCNGLHDPNHYTSAYDFALLGRYAALNYPELLKLCSIKHYRIRTDTKNPFQYDNTNKLLWFYPGTDGFKTGWTNDAKFCFTGTCMKNGLRLITSVMGVPVPKGHFADTKVLFNYGFSQYKFKEFYKGNEILAKISVGKGKLGNVEAIPESKIGITVPRGEDKELVTKVQLLPMVNAPVKKGQVLGYVSIVKKGQVIKQTKLLAKEGVQKGSLWQMTKKVFRGVIVR
jgi:D-alanyl-D-alanine carboxypeptidase (penicillin-binding protein 5/6)